MIFRDEIRQDELWKYSMECLNGYVDENLLSECGFHVNESEVKEDLAPKKCDDAWENKMSKKGFFYE